MLRDLTYELSCLLFFCVFLPNQVQPLQAIPSESCQTHHHPVCGASLGASVQLVVSLAETTGVMSRWCWWLVSWVELVESVVLMSRWCHNILLNSVSSIEKLLRQDFTVFTCSN